MELDRPKDAVELARRISSDQARHAITRLLVFARAGLAAEAEALFAELPAGFDQHDLKPRSLLALGRTEEALVLLNGKAVRGSRAINYLWDPIYDPVRNDPRWVKLMAETGLTEAHAPCAGVAEGEPAGETGGTVSAADR